MLSKVKAILRARKVKTYLLLSMYKYGWLQKDASAGNWTDREAKELQACEVHASRYR
jgi:hypothetical protein